MKTIIVALLAGCVVSLAQTNTDSSGYVTNAALLTPFTLTNSSGNVITDAVLVKLMPNKFLYKTPSGEMATRRLDSLSKDLQEKFGYNPQAAQAADEADKQKKAQQQLAQQQRETAAAQAAQDAIWQRVQKSQQHFVVTGDLLRVDEITADGILASYNFLDVRGISRSLIYFVKDSPNQNTLIDGATIGGPFYTTGTYTYTTVMGSSKTVECLTCSPKAAFNYYLIQADDEAKRTKEKAQQLIDRQRSMVILSKDRASFRET